MRAILLAMVLSWSVAMGAIKKPVQLQIAVTSDVHGTILPYDFINKKIPDGSLSKVSAYALQMRQNNDTAFILLDNGDILQGQPVMDYYHQIKRDTLHICAQVMNYIGYDAATVGNHDIECGHQVYDKLRSQFNFPWLSGNTIDTLTGKSFFKPYTIIERNGARIAIIGLTTPGIPEWLPRNLWAGLRFDDMIETASALVKEVKDKYKPDAIIGLFHAGVDATYGGQTEAQRFNQNASRLIALQVTGFDAIIAGHDHKPDVHPLVNKAGEKVLIVNPGSHSRYLGIINMTLSPGGNTATGKLLALKDLPDDNAFNRTFAPQTEEVKRYLNKRICTFALAMDINEALFGDCGFIDLLHRVQLQASGADISFAEPMALNVKVDSGAVYLNDLFKIYKYSNSLYTVRLTGDEVDRFLEYSYGKWFNQMTSGNDHLLNIGSNNRLVANVYNLSSAEGIRYTVDVTCPAGNRVTITGFTDGRAFDPALSYKVALSSYRANGGGGHLTTGAGLKPGELPGRVVSISDQDYRFLLMTYLEERSVIQSTQNDNWNIVPQAWVQAAKGIDSSILRIKD